MKDITGQKVVTRHAALHVVAEHHPAADAFPMMSESDQRTRGGAQ